MSFREGQDKAHIPVNSSDRVITLRVRETACHWYGKLRRVWRSPEKQRNLRAGPLYHLE